MKCKVEKCCCGFSLKTGSFIIGVMQAVFAGILLALYIVNMVTFAHAVSVIVKDPVTSPSTSEGLIVAEKLVISVQSILAVLAGIHMFFGVLLAYAAKKEKADLLKPWIIYAIIYLVLADILTLIAGIALIVFDQPIPGTQYIVSIIVATAVQSYYIIVVKSYRELLTNARRPIP